MTETTLPSLDDALVMLTAAKQQIEFSRRYTLELLEATPLELWWTRPSGSPTHIAWQVGHLAVSMYGLLMFRIYGRRDEDLELIPSKFRKAFARGSSALEQESVGMTAAELRERATVVYERSMVGLLDLDAKALLEPIEMPYAAYPIKLGAIMFCPLHEQIHAGQIGLIRRLLNLPSVR